jgi:cytoskeletal protein RodZ
VFEIGASLREARARQGLDFTEMEHRTKVRAKYLRALEDEQFAVLPGHTYIKGFLRTYADALGLDGQLYVDEYNSRFIVGDDEHPVRMRRVPQTRRRRERRESHLVLVALFAIAVVTALVIAAWRFGGPDEPKVRGVNAPATRSSTPTVTVSVRGAQGASYMEVRNGSRAGKPIYRGTLERGQRRVFIRSKLFVSLAAPANVVVLVDGKRTSVPASGELVAKARVPASS